MLCAADLSVHQVRLTYANDQHFMLRRDRASSGNASETVDEEEEVDEDEEERAPRKPKRPRAQGSAVDTNALFADICRMAQVSCTDEERWLLHVDLSHESETAAQAAMPAGRSVLPGT